MKRLIVAIAAMLVAGAACAAPLAQTSDDNYKGWDEQKATNEQDFMKSFYADINNASVAKDASKPNFVCNAQDDGSSICQTIWFHTEPVFFYTDYFFLNSRGEVEYRMCNGWAKEAINKICQLNTGRQTLFEWNKTTQSWVAEVTIHKSWADYHTSAAQQSQGKTSAGNDK
jgi:hypothetical protein